MPAYSRVEQVDARYKNISDSISFFVVLILSGKWVGVPATLLCAELNMAARSSTGSSFSLPGTPGGEACPANSVLSWAVSFEKLLEDPSGVNYFTVGCNT